MPIDVGQFAQAAIAGAAIADYKLTWMIVLATIPVGIGGVAGEHAFRVLSGHAGWAVVFLIANGLILLADEAGTGLIPGPATVRRRPGPPRSRN